MEEKRRMPETTYFFLHIFAMVTMLCDHLWGTAMLKYDILTSIGRITFPIFAFMIVEGYTHTKNLKKYVLRLLIFAVISEIPFNLMMGSRIFYPIHQNVLWTFLISIGLIHLNELARKKGKIWLNILTGIGTVILGYIVGIITYVDYYHYGILIVLVFYFFRQRKWWSFLGQALCLWYICEEMISGFAYEIAIGDTVVYFTRQCFAMLALIPIWLYRGKRGYHSKALQYFYYAFYPAHMLVLCLIKALM